MTSPTAATYKWQVNPRDTQELPALDLKVLEPGAASARNARLRALGSHLVTLLLALAVLAVLALGVGPRVLPYKVYTVLSGSMEPTLHIGSVVFLRPAPADQIHAGDIITFQRPDKPGEYVTHRVVSIADTPNGQAFITKGDANTVSDHWQIPAQGSGLKFWFDIPFLGYVFVMLQSPVGRISFILAPALILAAITINELWKDEPKAAA